MTPELARVLKHELTHSFVGQKSHGRAPTWLQEGVAQWMEGRRSSGGRARCWMPRPREDCPRSERSKARGWGSRELRRSFAYAWSLAVVESIIDQAA